MDSLPVYLIVGQGQQTINQQAQFPIRAILVDNPTNQFVFLSNLNRYVPPLTHSAVIPGDGSQTLQAAFVTPPGQVANIAVKGQTATIIALSDAVPASAGIQQPQGFQSTQQPLGTSAGGGTQIFTIPAGTHAIGLAFTSGGPRYVIVPVLSAVDTQIEISNAGGIFIVGVQTGITYYFTTAGTIPWEAAAILDTGAVYVWQPFGQSWTVNGVVAQGTPSNTQDAGVKSLRYDAAGAATSVILTATLSGTYRLLYLMGVMDAVSAGADVRLQDTSGTDYANIPASALAPAPIDFKTGLEIPSPLGVQLVVPAGVTIRGTLIYVGP